ncbi:MAG: DUF1643 domain-containing protein [Sandaracinaceae bacterium]
MGEQLTISPASSRGAGAVISPCKRYRYRLWRGAEPGRQAIFVGCNPSTAGASHDDATVRKFRGFTARWGCTGFEMLNACAYRARHPRDLLTVDDPVGPDNREAFDAAFFEARRWAEPLVVVGWGSALPKPLRHHAETALGWLEALGGELHCLGVTKGGQPRHPLMLSYSTALERFDG